jgi:uncharacterized protein YaaN involved in tellurite resistance
MTQALFDPKAIAADFDAAAMDTAEERSQVREMARAIDLKDPLAATAYGAGTQRGLSEVSEYLLERAGKGTQEQAHRVVNQLLGQIESLSPAPPRTGFFSGLFGAGQRDKPMLDDLEQTGLMVDRLASRLDQARLDLLKESALLDALYLQNRTLYHALNRQLQAGDAALALAASMDDSIRETFGRRLGQLRISKTLSLQMAAQIRLIQHSQRLMADRLRDVLTVVLPLWQQQLALGRNLKTQRDALEQYREAAQATAAALQQKAMALAETAALDHDADREARQQEILREILALQAQRRVRLE